MLRFPGFVGPSYTSQSRIADCERLVNWYPEKVESASGKAEFVLYPTPGFDVKLTLPNGPFRGGWSQNGRTFAVGGASLYEIDTTAWTATERSAILATRGNPMVAFASNGDGGHQMFLTTAGSGYLYDLNTNTLTLVLDQSAAQAGYIDGFFVALNPTTSTLQLSNLEDGSIWDPLDVSQRNSGADRWAGMVVAHKEIWLFGTQTTDVYYNSGGSSPFIPNPSVFLPVGIAAPYSATVLGGSPIWLGQSTDGDRIVYMANGYTPTRISTHAVEYALSTYSTVADAEGWTYQEQGHLFYVLTFPTAAHTWVYDATTGLWHERGAWDGTVFTALPVRGHVFANGVHLTGDGSTGAIYRMGTDLSSDGSGRILRRVRRAPHLGNLGGRVAFSALQVDLEAGLGLNSGQGSNPQVMLRWSDDGGQTWSAERWVTAGAQGAYKAMAIWYRLGQARDRVFEVAVSDPIPWRLIDAYLKIHPSEN